MITVSSDNLKTRIAATDERPSALEVILLKRTYVLPWTQFLYAEGGEDEVRLAFARKVARAKPPARLTPKSAKTVSVIARAATERIASSNPQAERPSHDEVQQRIAALKLKPTPARSSPDLFRYDPNEPLHLRPQDRKPNSGE